LASQRPRSQVASFACLAGGPRVDAARRQADTALRDKRHHWRLDAIGDKQRRETAKKIRALARGEVIRAAGSGADMTAAMTDMIEIQMSPGPEQAA